MDVDWHTDYEHSVRKILIVALFLCRPLIRIIVQIYTVSCVLDDLGRGTIGMISMNTLYVNSSKSSPSNLNSMIGQNAVRGCRWGWLVGCLIVHLLNACTNFGVGKRAQAILLPLILRRTKNSKLEGEPILKLPPKEIKLVSLKFTNEEREVSHYICCFTKRHHLLRLY